MHVLPQKLSEPLLDRNQIITTSTMPSAEIMASASNSGLSLRDRKSAERKRRLQFGTPSNNESLVQTQKPIKPVTSYDLAMSLKKHRSRSGKDKVNAQIVKMTLALLALVWIHFCIKRYWYTTNSSSERNGDGLVGKIRFLSSSGDSVDADSSDSSSIQVLQMSKDDKRDDLAQFAENVDNLVEAAAAKRPVDKVSEKHEESKNERKDEVTDKKHNSEAKTTPKEEKAKEVPHHENRESSSDEKPTKPHHESSSDEFRRSPRKHNNLHKAEKQTYGRNKEKESPLEEEIEVPFKVYIGEITIVILLSLLFEFGEDKLKESLEEEENIVALDIMDALYGELTILGFIGLLVFSLTRTGEADQFAHKLFPEWVAPEANPLTESFEEVHMVIFCVMIVFICQATMLVYIAGQNVRQWEQWESMSPKGFENSLERLLVEEGYISGSTGAKLKNYHQGTMFEQMFRPSGLRAIIRWHAIRHVFLYPVQIAEDHELGDDGGSASGQVEVKDPASFDFKMYLTNKLGKLFIELVDVDTRTWFAALILVVPGLWFTSLLTTFHIMVLQFSIGVTFNAIYVFLLYDMTRIQMELCPSLCADANQFILHMSEGWKKMEEARLGDHHKRGEMFGGGGETLEVEETSGYTPGTYNVPGGSGDAEDAHGPGGVFGIAITAGMRCQLSGSSVTTHEAMFSPMHLRKLKEKSDLAEKIQSAGGDQSLIRQHLDEHKNRKSKRPWYVKFVGGKKDYIPHSHDELFHFHEKGVVLHNQIMRTMMFFEAILIATLIITLEFKREGWLEWFLCFCNWIQWPLQLVCFLPRIVSKYVIISSIESYKDNRLIQEVTLVVKERRLRQAVALMQMVKLKGRREKLGGETISDLEYKAAKQKFEKFKEEKKLHIENTFNTFDEDHSGTIEAQELENVLSTMGIFESSDVHQSAMDLISIVNQKKDGQLTLEEFQVLMVLAHDKQTSEEEIEDLDAFFELIDEDGDDKLSYGELARVFRESFNIPLSRTDIGELIYHCFKTVKSELDKDDFIVWMRYLGDEDAKHVSGASEEHKAVKRKVKEEVIELAIDNGLGEGEGSYDDDGNSPTSTRPIQQLASYLFYDDKTPRNDRNDRTPREKFIGDPRATVVLRGSVGTVPPDDAYKPLPKRTSWNKMDDVGDMSHDLGHYLQNMDGDQNVDGDGGYITQSKDTAAVMKAKKYMNNKKSVYHGGGKPVKPTNSSSVAEFSAW